MKGKTATKSIFLSRRNFLKRTAAAAGTVIGAPYIIDCSVLGANAPSNRITVGCIGVGRQCMYSDLPEFLGFKEVQVVAVCDADSKRLQGARQRVEKHYSSLSRNGSYIYHN